MQLGDFGLVTKQPTSATDDPSDLQELDSESGEPSTAEGLGGGGNGGTMSYAAPELLFGMRPTTAVDMWATGCLAAEMIIGRVLFHAATFTQQVRHTWTASVTDPNRWQTTGDRPAKKFVGLPLFRQ